MTTVQIAPLPAWARKTRYKPLPLPIFPDGTPTAEDRALAAALWQELDAESQAWYGAGFVERMRNPA